MQTRQTFCCTRLQRNNNNISDDDDNNTNKYIQATLDRRQTDVCFVVNCVYIHIVLVVVFIGLAVVVIGLNESTFMK